MAEILTEGSHWNKYGLSSSQPATNSETPKGRTPLHVKKIQNNTSNELENKHNRKKGRKKKTIKCEQSMSDPYPDCVYSCITDASLCTSCDAGICSLYIK